MLTGQLGIRLILWTGPTIPVPAPIDLLRALRSVEVTNDSEGTDGFRLTFSLAKGLGDYSLLQSGIIDPYTRVVIGVMMGASPQPLIDGVVDDHQFQPSMDPGMSTLTVMGRDVSTMLSLEEKNRKFDQQSDSTIFEQVVGEYGQYGLVPSATSTSNTPSQTDRIPRQAETDLALVRRLAQSNGFVFYVEPLTFGSNTAYFGPRPRFGPAQPPLSYNVGPDSNVTSLSVHLDANAPVSPQGTFVEPNSGTSIPIPALPSLRIPPLAANVTTARRTTLMRDTANQDAGDAATALLAVATNAPDSVSLEGTVDAVRYGAVLRARRLVGMRGVGGQFNGDYLVKRVTHRIERERESYTQSFVLGREGTGSLVPLVF